LTLIDKEETLQGFLLNGVKWSDILKYQPAAPKQQRKKDEGKKEREGYEFVLRQLSTAVIGMFDENDLAKTASKTNWPEDSETIEAKIAFAIYYIENSNHFLSWKLETAKLARNLLLDSEYVKGEYVWFGTKFTTQQIITALADYLAHYDALSSDSSSSSGSRSSSSSSGSGDSSE